MKNKKEQAIKEFENIKDKAIINTLSKKSLKKPLTEKEFNKYQNTFFRYYNIPNIFKQDFRQVKGKLNR